MRRYLKYLTSFLIWVGILNSFSCSSVEKSDCDESTLTKLFYLLNWNKDVIVENDDHTFDTIPYYTMTIKPYITNKDTLSTVFFADWYIDGIRKVPSDYRAHSLEDITVTSILISHKTIQFGWNGFYSTPALKINGDCLNMSDYFLNRIANNFVRYVNSENNLDANNFTFCMKKLLVDPNFNKIFQQIKMQKNESFINRSCK